MIGVAERSAATHTFIHAEVYQDPDATKVAPIVTSLAMTYEPALFVSQRGTRLTDAQIAAKIRGIV